MARTLKERREGEGEATLLYQRRMAHIRVLHIACNRPQPCALMSMCAPLLQGQPHWPLSFSLQAFTAVHSEFHFGSLPNSLASSSRGVSVFSLHYLKSTLRSPGRLSDYPLPDYREFPGGLSHLSQSSCHFHIILQLILPPEYQIEIQSTRPPHYFLYLPKSQ